jgi:CheY-like chemotaxis protein
MATILVIDDEPSVRRSLRRTLEVEGYAVLEAGDGKEALTALRAGSVDLIITDVFMPEMDGIEFLIEHLEQSSEIPVIAVSGGGRISSDSVLTDAGLIGAVETLAKPLSVDGVLRAVRRVLSTE